MLKLSFWMFKKTLYIFLSRLFFDSSRFTCSTKYWGSALLKSPSITLPFLLTEAHKLPPGSDLILEIWAGSSAIYTQSFNWKDTLISGKLKSRDFLRTFSNFGFFYSSKTSSWMSESSRLSISMESSYGMEKDLMLSYLVLSLLKANFYSSGLSNTSFLNLG